MAKKTKRERNKPDLDIFDLSPDELDRLWLEHPRIVAEQAVQHVDYQDDCERAKAALEVVRAELDGEIRRNPEDYGVEKITETVVQNTVVLQAAYKRALEKVLEASRCMKMSSAMLKSLDDRKKALENLVQLHGQNYFSVPRSKGVGKEVAEEIQKAGARRRGKRRS